MAVERVREFLLDLGDIVKMRIDNFSIARKRIQAGEEANFQRRILDNDLSYRDQLDYRQRQLEVEEERVYPDGKFIEEIKTSISSFKKLIRRRDYRDSYLAFLTDLASGKKTLVEHLEYLQNALSESWDTEIRDDIREQIVKVTGQVREQERKIVDSQIAFRTKDRTAASLDEAMDLVKKQLNKPEVQKDRSLMVGYEQQLATLTKEKLEVEIEDKATWMAISSLTQDRENASLWKLEVFSGLRDKAGMDVPVNVGGTRYASEREYWQTTLNGYIQSGFANEYVKENKGEAAVIWNKLGLLPNSYLDKLVANNQLIKSHAELQNFQRTIVLATQESIINALDLKAKDLTAKYYLNEPDIAIERDYEQAKQELENLKILFGADYSLSPAIQTIETKLIAKRVKTTGDILAVVKDVMANPKAYGESPDITWEEALRKYGPSVALEVPAEKFKEKTPMEMAKELPEEAKVVTEKWAEKEKLEEQKKKLEEAVAGKLKVKPSPEVPIEKEAPREEQKEILSTVESYKPTFPTAKEGFREDLIERLVKSYGEGYRQFIIDTVYRELRSPEKGEPSYVPPAPVPAPTPAPTPAPVPAPTAYTGLSIVDYLKSIGKASDFASREKSAISAGIKNYRGTAEQNTALLNYLRAGTPIPVIPKVSVPTPTPAPVPTAVSVTVPPPAPVPAPIAYTGVSIVDYLKSIRQPSGFASRAKLAEQKGIKDYVGSATQNLKLLKKLRGF